MNSPKGKKAGVYIKVNSPNGKRADVYNKVNSPNGKQAGDYNKVNSPDGLSLGVGEVLAGPSIVDGNCQALRQTESHNMVQVSDKNRHYKNTQNDSIYMNESKDYSLVSMCGQTLTENATELSNNNKD